MNDNRKPKNDDVVQAVYAYAASLLREGKSSHEIRKALIERGLSEEAAYTVVDQLSRARSDAMSNAERDNAVKNMLIGGVICIIGLVISIGSFQAASSSSSGGSYVVAWGAVIFGGWQFLKGLMAYLG